ncbi:DUF86 domain-containing protein [Lentibacillus cibarius]|uniref:DUF86 domain-containing protein n=1 Tax=Lentibacillus cibarius TaxID=2583219 RepID=A0A5S3QH86_9BACI|nr:DUF86 domain-containing protein [Lentibacillus cibarius]TMN21262.1 DUF86 domain-containing protein [Lentibacillus cibarius]
MYFVDQKKIEKTLTYMEKVLSEVNHQPANSFKDKLFLERATELIIETVLDVGNMMIDGFIMRDPGSFEDIIDILVDEKVLPKADEAGYKEIITLRKMVVKDYLTIDHTLLDSTLQRNKEMLSQFGSHIRSYLNDEAGVANAFSND